MDKELVELILEYIDRKIYDEIENHRTTEHGGCYYNYYNEAEKIKGEIFEHLK
jgi:hypothetical protein